MNKLNLKYKIFLSSFFIFIILGGCANRNIVSPVVERDPLLTYRWLAVGTVIILTFFRLGIMEGKKTQSGNAWAIQNILKAIIGIPFCWTKIGEWGYLISKWIFNLWKPLVPISNFITGLQGDLVVVLGGIIVLGFVFPDPELFYWSIIPSLLGLVINTLYLYISPNNNNSKNDS